MTKQMTVANLIARLQSEFNPDDLILTSLWVADDIKGCAEAVGVNDLTDNDIDRIMELAYDNHDAEIGLTIDRLQDVILDYKEA